MAAETAGSEEIAFGPGYRAAWAEEREDIGQDFLPHFDRAKTDDDEPHVHEVECALQLLWYRGEKVAEPK